MNLTGKNVNFLGDSITQGVGVTSMEAHYTNLLRCRAKLGCVRNYGISGTRIARQRKLNVNESAGETNSFVKRFADMDNNADLVVVFGGINDWAHGNAPFGSDENRTMDTFCGALHYLMKGLIEKYPAATICFLTPLHMEGDTVPIVFNHLPLEAYVKKIKETARRYSIPVLDLYGTSGILPDIPAQKELYCPDGIHPNDRGNERIAERLQAFLESL